MAKLDQNVSPYYDDFDDTKNYKRILFRPSFAVQARELTQLQTNLSDQIKSVTSPIFENGEALIPGELRYNKSNPALKLKSDSGTYLQNSYTITDTTSSKYLIGKYIKGQNSGAIAKVITAKPATQSTDLQLYLSVMYGTFSNNDVLKIYNTSDGTSGDTIGTSAASSALGTAVVVAVKSGTFFINGHSVYTPDQILVVDLSSFRRIGFNVVESFVTESDDSTLLDNSSGTTNFQAPGADRYKIELTLASKPSLTTGTLSALTTADENFIEIGKFDSQGEFIDLTNNYGDTLVEQDDLDDLVAQDNGNYIEQAPIISLKDDTHSSTTVSVGAGTAYIDGKEVKFDETDISLTKPSDFTTKEKSDSTYQWKGLDISFTQGSSVVTSGGIIGNDTGLGNLFKLGDSNQNEVTLRRQLGSETVSDAQIVATAKVRNIETVYGITAIQMQDEDSADNYGKTAKPWQEGELIEAAQGGNPTGAVGRLLHIEQKMVTDALATPGKESTILYVELYSGYFQDSDTITGLTSGAKQNVADSDTGGYLYEQFESKQEYRFYLYDIEFKENDTTSALYNLKDANVLLYNSIIAANLESNFTSKNTDDYDFGQATHDSTGFTFPNQFAENTSDYGADDTLTSYNTAGTQALVAPTTKEGVLSLDKVSIDRVRKWKAVTPSSTTSMTLSLNGDNHIFGVNSANEPLDHYGDIIIFGKDTTDNKFKVFKKSDFTFTYSNNESLVINREDATRVIPVAANNTADVTTDANVTLDTSGTYIIIYTAKVLNTLSNVLVGKTLTANSQTFDAYSDVAKKYIELEKQDVLPTNFKVYQTADFQTAATSANAVANLGGVDITERYEIDTGQRDSYYTKATLNLKEPYKSNGIYPTGRLLVVYYFFDWSANSGYISAGSYFSNATEYNTGKSFTASTVLPNGVEFESKRKKSDGTSELGKLYPEDIPVYQSSSGEKIRLIDAIDFRTLVTGSDVTNFLQSPSNGVVSIDTITYKEPKNITIFLANDGTFKTTLSESASHAPDFDRLIPICNVYLPGNVFDKDDIIIKPIESNKKKALDIGKIEKLIDDLDNKKIVSVESIDLELDGIKGSVFTDNFDGHNKADVANSEHDASIDIRKNELRPGFTQESLAFDTAHAGDTSNWINPTGTTSTDIPLGYLTSGSLLSGSTYKIVEVGGTTNFSNLGAVNQQGDVFTVTGGSVGDACDPTAWGGGKLLKLPTKGHSLIGQRELDSNDGQGEGLLAGFYNQQSTEDMSIKSSDVSSYYGTMQLEPSFSLFKSTKSTPDVVNDKKGIYNSIKEGKKTETIWEDWKTNWHGDNMRQLDSDSNIKSTLSNYDSNSNVQVFNDKKVNLDYVPYMKSETITATVHGLEPSAADLNFTFDGFDYTKVVVGEMVNSSTYSDVCDHPYINDVSNLQADKSGKLAFTFTPPNEDEGIVYVKVADGGTGTFTSGERVYQLHEFDTVDNMKDSYIRPIEYNIVSGTVIWHDTTSDIIALKEVDGEFKTSPTTNALFADGYIRNEGNDKFHLFESYFGQRKYRVGTKNLKISGSGTASAAFHATGLPDNTLSTRNLEASENGQLNNSVVQIIKPTQNMILSKLDLYFSARDAISGTTVSNRPVILQIRTVKNGKATNQVLPFSTVIKHDIDATSITGNVATTFEFEEYLTLFKGVSYAITIITNGDYKLRVLDTYSNAGTKPAGFKSFWRGNKRLPNKALKILLYSSFHKFTNDTVYFRTKTLPNIELDKYAISTVAGESYLKIHLPGHGFRANDTMKLSGVVGRTETKVTFTSATGLDANNGERGVKVYETGATAITDPISSTILGYDREWGHIVKLESHNTTGIIHVALANGILVDQTLKSGKTSTDIGMVSAVVATSEKYFAGVQQTNANGTVYTNAAVTETTWKVASGGLTANEFRLTRTSPTDEHKFQRTGVVIDAGKISLVPAVDVGPRRNADLIHYSGRTISPNKSVNSYRHKLKGITATDSPATLNYDTLLDYNFDIKDNLEFYWKDGRGSFSAYDVPWLDRKTLSATVVKNLSSSNYVTRKNILPKAANSLRVVLDANLPRGTGIKVYAKTAITNYGKNSMSTLYNFDNFAWQEILPDQRILTDNSNKFRTYQFTRDRISQFDLYQVKIVMTTDDSTNVAKVKNLKVIPNMQDNSLKPMQSAAVSVELFVSNTNNGLGSARDITIPSDFVVETATVIINGAQDNNATATSYADHGILIGSDIKKYGDGTIFPALSTLQTGCVAKFWYDTSLEQHVIEGDNPDGYNVRATVLMFGRKP